MKKAVLIALFPGVALAGAVQPPPPTVPPPKASKPVPKTPKPKVNRPLPKKEPKKREVVLPAPEFIYKTQDVDRFEREKEKLVRQKQLLQLKVEIARLEQELNKYRLPPVQVKPARAPREEKPKVNPALELQKEYLRLREQRERFRELQSKLSTLQSLFTGVMKVGNNWVAFDSEGRKYSVGSVVYGFVISKILPDGVVVSSPEGVFKVPISAVLPEKKTQQANQQQFQPPPPPPPPPPQQPEELPPELPPPPVGG